MPKITIFEKDLTTPITDELSDNIVYVPGYAIMGPVNTPILCTNVNQFQSIFGTLPYRFKNTYLYPSAFSSEAKGNTSFIIEDEYEKSYIYAVELLKNGLPVYYERVMNKDNVQSWIANKSFAFEHSVSDPTSKFEISAKNPGEYGTLISYTIEKVLDSDETNPDYKLDLLLVEGNGIKETVSESLIISFVPTNKNYYANVESDLVELTVINSIPNEGSSLIISEASGNLALEDASADEFVPSDIYNKMNLDTEENLFYKLSDKNEYNIKFITSGAYPVFEYSDNKIVKQMLTIAASRGDSIAIIDHTNIIDRSLTSGSSVYSKLQQLEPVLVGELGKQEDARKYGTMFTPYAIYDSTVLNQKVVLPASFAYLNSLAISVKTNENWYAVAGVTRGLVPDLKQPVQTITGAIADLYQTETKICINPIINIKQYGYCIWGNRTLNKSEGLVASSFLNIRSISNDVKKLVYNAAKELTFELNNDILWLTFRSKIEPTLDKMVSGNGLSSYKVIKKTSTKRATIEAVIRLYAIEAVENWDITIELADSYVSIE